MAQTPPETMIQSIRRRPFGGVSLVWLVPLAAVAVAVFIVWQTWRDRGPLIEIAFENASGVRAGETELRFRDVTVGLVEEVRFAEGLGSVIVAVRLDQAVAGYVDADAAFWVVRPQVTAQGVSGLDTVLSGVFIAGSWDQVAGVPQTSFDGLPSPPLIRNDQPGLAIRLRSTSSDGLAEGTPILYRGIAVGSIGNLRLSEDGIAVLADGFVAEPHDRLITSATRFWDTSGFDFTVGAQGAKLNVSSLASLITGGVSFDTTVSTGEAVEQGAVFTLFDDEDAARGSVFSDVPDGGALNLSVVFEQSVAGLAPGAPVQFQGIDVGRVTALTGFVDEARFGDRRVRLLATLAIQASRMGLAGPAGDADGASDESEQTEATEAEEYAFVAALVGDGLRAQLQTAGLLGGLRVALIDPLVPADPDAVLDMDAEPYPLLPSIPAELSDFADTAEGVFQRVNALPIEEVLGAAVAVMDSVDRLLNSDGVTAAPEQALALLAEVRGLIGSQAVQRIPSDVTAVLNELQTAIADLDGLLIEIRDAGTVAAVTAAVTATEGAADDVAASVADLPELIAAAEAALISVDALVQTANGLPLDALATEAIGTLADARALLTDPAIAGLVADLRATVQTAQGLVADLRDSDLIANANAILASVETAVSDVQAALTPVLAAAEQAAADVGGAVAGLPQVIAGVTGLTAQIDTLLTEVNALPLAEASARAMAILGSAEAIVSAPAAQQLPADLSLALSEAQGLIADVRASGLVENAGATLATAQTVLSDVQAALTPVLAAAEQAAADVGGAVAGLPQVIAGVTGLTAQIDTLLTEVNALPLAEASARAMAILGSAEAIVSTPAAQQLPADLSLALSEAQGLIADVRAADVVARVDSTLAATETAVAEVTAALTPVLAEARRAAAALGDATDAVPALVAQAESIAADVEALVSQARDLPLDTLVTRANNLLASANLFVGSPEALAVPAALTNALQEVQRILVTVQEGGLIENANRTLTSTQEAAAAFAASTDALPALVAQVNALLAQTETVIGGYEVNGALGSEARAALRDIREAARSFNSLARTIERNPSSLLLGR